MATPALLLQTASKVYSQQTPQELDFGIVKDPDGVAIDIDTGFAAFCSVRFSRNRDAFPATNLSGTWAYGSDGTLTLTKTQAQALDLPVGSWPYTVWLTNDSDTTRSTHMQGTITVTPGA